MDVVNPRPWATGGPERTREKHGNNHPPERLGRNVAHVGAKVQQASRRGLSGDLAGRVAR